LFEANARELGLGNPFESAYNEIQKLLQQLSRTKLNGDFFPDLENPFSNLPEPTLGPAANLGTLPPMITGANPNVLAANQQLVPQLNNLPKTEQYKVLFPNG
jgi:hypothetical protein